MFVPYQRRNAQTRSFKIRTCSLEHVFLWRNILKIHTFIIDFFGIIEGNNKKGEWYGKDN